MNISCRPSSCARFSLAQTTTEALLPYRIFIDLRPIVLRHSGLGNPRLRYNNYGATDCRIWRPPFTAYCSCVVISSCSLCTTTTMSVSRYDEYSYPNVTVSAGTAQAVIQSIRILSSYLSFSLTELHSMTVSCAFRFTKMLFSLFPFGLSLFSRE